MTSELDEATLELIKRTPVGGKRSKPDPKHFRVGKGFYEGRHGARYGNPDGTFTVASRNGCTLAIPDEVMKGECFTREQYLRWEAEREV